jgi:hypothetical protein
MGTSVPRAVVVRARPTTTRPGQFQWTAPDLLEVELVAGQEDEEGQAEVGEPDDDAADVGDVEHVGTHEDPEADLDDDLGDGHRAGELRHDGGQNGGDGDEHQGAHRSRRHADPPSGGRLAIGSL